MSDNTTLSSQVNRLSTGDPSTDDAPSELVATVDDLLNQLSSKFSTLSGEMIAKMDEMSRRLDSLEATIQAGNAAGEGGSESDK